MTHRLRIVVGGLAGLYPVGGVAWDYLQYVIGFADLGHDVYYHEDTWSWPYDPVRRTFTDDPRYSAGYLGRFFDRYAPELADRWHYRHLGETSHGMTERAIEDAAGSADLFVNVSGAMPVQPPVSTTATTVFVDTDPGYNQIVYLERPDWSEFVDRWCDNVDAHDVHLTYGENLGAADYRVPDTGHTWRPTRMPVVTRLWRPAPPPSGAPWTTVMTWNTFGGPLVHDGVEFHGKGHAFEKIAGMPRDLDEPFAIAVGGTEAPLDRLAAVGWTVLDGPAATRSPDAYQGFIRRSRGEVSTAKHVYTALRTGWFSTRSACYLASGRPVVVEDTGFTDVLPTGSGILPFADAEGAAAAVGAVEADWERHATAAREIAESEFEASRVLGELIEVAGAT